MNEFDPEQFEAELRTLKPAKPSHEFLNRVSVALTEDAKGDCAHRGTDWPSWDWRALLRWLAPVVAMAAVAAFWYFEYPTPSPTPPRVQRLGSSSRPPLRADKVEIDRQLLADFDAVGQLASGEPVRFRCHQWVDKVKLSDSAAGLVIERKRPRLEIVPVRFETY
jgi:hypothetical protein